LASPAADFLVPAQSLEKLKIFVIYQRGPPARTMIVCSCNIITRRDIEGVIERILADDPYAVLTPNLIYHRLGRRGRCCGCFPLVTQVLVEHCIFVREQLASGGAVPEDFDAGTPMLKAKAG
jgi:hypothetical protein